MKRMVMLSVTAMLTAALLAGCSNISQEEYDNLTAENKTLNASVKELEGELETAQTNLSEAEAAVEENEAALQKAKEDLAGVQQEYDDYKEKMKPFEEMTEAQAAEEKARAEQEKKRIEEEEAAKKAAEEEAAAQAAAEEQAAREAEEAKGYETGITYEQLARTPDEYKGKKVKFKGKVIQVLDGGSEVNIRLAVNSDYDTVLLGYYDASIVSSRVLEDDVITIYGVSGGLHSYQSTFGGTITIPLVKVDKIEQ